MIVNRAKSGRTQLYHGKSGVDRCTWFRVLNILQRYLIADGIRNGLSGTMLLAFQKTFPSAYRVDSIRGCHQNPLSEPGTDALGYHCSEVCLCIWLSSFLQTCRRQQAWWYDTVTCHLATDLSPEENLLPNVLSCDGTWLGMHCGIFSCIIWMQ